MVGFHTAYRERRPFLIEQVQFETNRMRFIGRGRTLRNPVAMESGADLSGDYGPFLDPIASLRVAITLEPGQSQEVTFVLGPPKIAGY